MKDFLSRIKYGCAPNTLYPEYTINIGPLQINWLGFHYRKIENLLHEGYQAIDRDDYKAARKIVETLRSILGKSTPDVTRLDSFISFMELPLD